MKDLYSNITVLPAIDPVTQSNSDTALVSDIIDTAGYESLTFLIATGGLTDTNATFTVLVEDGDSYTAPSTLSDAAAVSDTFLLGTEAGASFTFGDDGETRKIGYNGHKRYVRLTITPSGNNSGDAPLSAVAVLGTARHNPLS